MGYVVVHEGISVLDPETRDGRREDRNWLFLSRGSKLPDKVSTGEVERLLAADAIADESDTAGQLALGGIDRRDSRAGPVQQVVTNEPELVRAAQSAMQQPGGVKPDSTDAELARLHADHLAVVAKALGIPVGANTKKEDLIQAIKARRDDAEGDDVVAKRREVQTQAQLDARESGVAPAVSAVVLGEDDHKPADADADEPGMGEKSRSRRRTARPATDDEQQAEEQRQADEQHGSNV